MSEEKGMPGVAPAAPAVVDAERMRPLKNVGDLRAERVAQCAAEVNAVLEKHKCRLLAVVVIAGGQVQERVEVVSL